MIHLVFFALAALFGGAAVALGAALSADIRAWVSGWLARRLAAAVELTGCSDAATPTIAASPRYRASQRLVLRMGDAAPLLFIGSHA